MTKTAETEMTILSTEEREALEKGYAAAKQQIENAPEDAQNIDLAREALAELDALGGVDYLERQGLISTVVWLKERVKARIARGS